MQQFPSITIGTVMDTNDPQQMGRLKILCPSLGDDNNLQETDHLPWATMGSPLGGMVNSNGFTRGSDAGATSSGPVAYGMWNVPKRGSSVIVMCIDGDPYYRVCMGAVYDQGSMNTLPHGRFFYQANSSLPENGEPEGPLNSYQQPIQPLYDNMTQAYGGRSGNFEWRTRGADYSVGGNPAGFTHISPSAVADEVTPTPFQAEDGTSFTVQNGYATNRLTGYSSDNESSTYSWTTPGFHSISMDDRPENCRMRLRSSNGSQIILDDTNERIYINNALGTNWVQMDYDGNIDVFATMRINLHSEADINLTADQSVRIYGKQGVFITSGTELVEQAQQISMQSTSGDIISQASGDIVSEASGNISTKAGAAHYTQAGGNINSQAGGAQFVQGGAAVNILAGGAVLLSGSDVQLNGTPASPASSALSATALGYKLTNRVPQHEPWGRCTTTSDTNQAPLYPYNSPNVGRQDATRGQFWRR